MPSQKIAKGHHSRLVRYRLSVFSRILAAVFGGYGVSSLATMVLSLALPMPRAEAVQAATLLSFAVMVCIVLWVFSVVSATRAWLGLILAALPLALAWWWLAFARTAA